MDMVILILTGSNWGCQSLHVYKQRWANYERAKLLRMVKMFIFGSSRDESFLQKIEFILFLTISGVSLTVQAKKIDRFTIY